MPSLVLIRHGETDWNVAGRYQGQADPPLNDRGVQQARQLARDLGQSGIERLISSPLQRALQTARIISETLDVPLDSDPRLMEIHQGDWQTRLRSEIEALYPDIFRAWETTPWEVTPPGGEHLSQVQARVEDAVRDWLAKFPMEKLGLVLHRIPIALIKMQYQGLQPDVVRSLNLPNAYWEEIVIND